MTEQNAIPDGFWRLIALFHWHDDPDSERCKRLLKALFYGPEVEQEGLTLEDFKAHYNALAAMINDETNARVEKDQTVFAEGVEYGGDDCHFMDMPAHLITLGKDAVQDYVSNNGLIGFEPAECFSYSFQP